MNWTIDKKAVDKDYWNIVWSRPYVNYEGHHKFFWDKTRKEASGTILDLGCGSASCWKGLDGGLIYGCDYSDEAINEAIKNVAHGHFVVDAIPTNRYDGWSFTTIVLSGFINYYENLRPILNMLKRIDYKKIIITINVVDDYPGRHWDEKTIKSTFGELGNIVCEFFDKVGWFVVISKF